MTENVTTFLSSHDAQEVRSLCRAMSVIAKGRFVYTGATRELGAKLEPSAHPLLDLLLQRAPHRVARVRRS
jgi:ABC-type multidrug transport system ATPase subunit